MKYETYQFECNLPGFFLHVPPSSISRLYYLYFTKKILFTIRIPFLPLAGEIKIVLKILKLIEDEIFEYVLKITEIRFQ